MSKYYRGNYFEDSKKEYDQHKGWLVGDFMECFRKTNAVEIKFWKFKTGEDTKHENKLQCRAIECTFILKGQIKGEIDNEKVILNTGEYVVIPPRVVNGFTIKAPSDKTDKITEKMFGLNKKNKKSKN
jgi:quercetin dioxygenase-like cupin family protein